ncbi:MAG: hypothetical protein MUC55_10575, partial [Burkholderiales bacterium]|nr:hypothetical protein [Burkholderiales bacterium]
TKRAPVELIEVTQEGFVGSIVLDNPRKLNALSHDLVEGVIAALARFAESDVRVVANRVFRSAAGC